MYGARGHRYLVLSSLVVLAAKFTRVNVGKHCALLHGRAGCYLSRLEMLLDRGETADDIDQVFPALTDECFLNRFRAFTG